MRYTIDIAAEPDEVSPVAMGLCGYCKSFVIVVGQPNSRIVCLPLVCEQPTFNSYPCGGKMARVHDLHVREIVDNLAAFWHDTDDS